MLYIKTDWEVPFYNMALEEHILSEFPEEDVLFFYTHAPSVIVGRHQNTLEELDRAYVEANAVHVARRLSGGGAVYHDGGNLNYSLITKRQELLQLDFAALSEPILRALCSVGVMAQASGRNDLTIDGKKFSGAAQVTQNNRLLHHGTLLFNSDLDCLQRALTVKDLKVESKGIKSVRSRVTNISDHLPKPMSLADFKALVLAYLTEDRQCRAYVLTQADLQAVDKKVREKFGTWAWNWGQSPACTMKRVKKFPCGILDLRVDLEDGRIKALRLYGDFFCRHDPERLLKALLGAEYGKYTLKEQINSLPVEETISGLTKAEFMDLLFE